MILGLDISTSTIGIAIMGDDCTLHELTHVKLKGASQIKDKLTGKSKVAFGSLYNKVGVFRDFLVNRIFKNHEIKEVIVEAPLTSAATPITAAMLQANSGLIYYMLREFFNEEQIKYISVDDARRYGFPELVQPNKKGERGKNGSLFTPLTTRLRKLRKELSVKIKTGECKKIAILYIISKKFSNIQWNINRSYNLQSSCFDQADAVAAILGYKALSGTWKISMLDESVNDEIIEYIKADLLHRHTQKEISSMDIAADNKRTLKEELSKNHYDKLTNIDIE